MLDELLVEWYHCQEKLLPERPEVLLQPRVPAHLEAIFPHGLSRQLEIRLGLPFALEGQLLGGTLALVARREQGAGQRHGEDHDPGRGRRDRVAPAPAP